MENQGAMEFSNISAETALSVLDTCIKLRGTTDFYATMKEVIRDIRDLCDAEHCCILSVNERERSCAVLCEALSADTKLISMEAYVNDEFYDIAETWAATIAGGSCLIVKDEEGMELIRERNPVWYASLTGAGAHNIVMFPLKSRNELLGYVWAINFDKERTTRIRETLEVTTFIVASEMGNYILLEKLRELSSKDMLTGVMNRNEMNNVVDMLCHTNDREHLPVGVIFAALNGLKGINDFEGHNAGNVILRNAANVLREVFAPEEIFRATGDEFVMIAKGLDAAGVAEKIALIRSGSEKYGNVVFALGGGSEEDSRNVRMALRCAAENMYEDKRALFMRNADGSSNDAADGSKDTELDERFRERTIFREMNYDRMTGLPSMTYFFKLAEEGRRNMHERGVASAVVFINLSGLKYYNKKYGFAEGDQLIKELGMLIAMEFGDEHCSRFGQDHFAVYTETEGLERHLKKIFRDARMMNNGNTLPVRAGIYPDSMGLAETSLACDRAKYACNSKRDDNRSYFSYFDEKMLESENNRQYIVDHLEQAINENWIRAFYQPIVRSTTRKVCDEEALARWIDPQKGMLSPAEFIPILEEARLIYKVDLHIVDIILERFKSQKIEGGQLVPISVNLSRTDFESCDIVEEINNRCRAAGVSPDLLTVEITESVIGENFDFMKEQIDRFRKLGFKVWMDDFGSGYSSLDLLQELHFDLIKFDMRFMRQFESTPKSRLILTQLARLAQSLGIETVCEGVETAEQADFLSEIGCTRMQGYYFCKPISIEMLKERYAQGKQIGFENPAEAGYFKQLDDINMFEFNTIADEDTRGNKLYFDSLPMAVVEYDGEKIDVVRCNRSYKEFFLRYIAASHEEGLFGEVKENVENDIFPVLDACIRVGDKGFINGVMEDGTTVQSMVKKLADNNVRSVSAFLIAVMDITVEKKRVLSFKDVAQALATEYIAIYYVNTETDSFEQYSTNGSGRGIAEERHGEHFFGQARRDIKTMVYEPDCETFLQIFNKENVLRTIEETGAFTHTYRLLIKGVPTYALMKIVRMSGDNKHIVIGVYNVDVQMRQKEALEHLKEEHTTYTRIMALLGDFYVLYTVDPESGRYTLYRTSAEFSEIPSSSGGEDFYEDAIRDIRRVIHPDDYEHFVKAFSKEKILSKTKNGGIYKVHYRLMMGEGPTDVVLRAGMITEDNTTQMIVGVGRSSQEE